MLQPAIKWSGSKRPQAKEIVSHFPSSIKTYYEPFCGGCSVLMEAINSGTNIERYVCSDINNDLISLLNYIKESPNKIIEHYSSLWEQLNDDDNIDRKKSFYEFVRNRFNKERSPLDFMFLNRTSCNGLIRYNKKGEFNSPFHLNRKGIEPITLKKIINSWSETFNKCNIRFINCSYTDIHPIEGDFLYLDPPYANTKQMYFNDFDNGRFFDWLGEVNCSYLLSYNGKSGEDDNTFPVPKSLYNEHIYIKSGNSSFKRIKEIDKSADVYESLYIK